MKADLKRTDWAAAFTQAPLALPVRSDLNLKRRTGQRNTAKAHGVIY